MYTLSISTDMNQSTKARDVLRVQLQSYHKM